jgi:hypothetical protein
MIALSMVLRGRTMSLGGVFMMLSCFVMCVFCHMRVLRNRYFDSLNQDFHYRLLVSDSILPPASLAVVGTQFVSCGSPKLKRQCFGASEMLSSRLGQHVTPNVVRIGRGLGSDWADPNRIEDGILPGLQPSLVPEGDAPPVARSSGDYVTVMQSTESRQRGDLVRAWRHRRRNSTSGRVLPQPEMSPVFVVIADVFSQQASQVPLVQYDYVAKQIPTHTPNPALGDAILPGTAKSGSDGFCAVLFDGRDDSNRELRVPVED